MGNRQAGGKTTTFQGYLSFPYSGRFCPRDELGHHQEKTLEKDICLLSLLYFLVLLLGNLGKFGATLNLNTEMTNSGKRYSFKWFW